MIAATGGVVELFCDLAAIPSPSRAERAVADRVLQVLRGLGLEPDEDDAGGRIGSEIGNIYCRLPPTAGADGTPIFLNAHLDTVPADGPIEPEVRNGIVVNRRDTILGADNKAAVAVILAVARRLVGDGSPVGSQTSYRRRGLLRNRVSPLPAYAASARRGGKSATRPRPGKR